MRQLLKRWKRPAVILAAFLLVVAVVLLWAELASGRVRADPSTVTLGAECWPFLAGCAALGERGPAAGSATSFRPWTAPSDRMAIARCFDYGS